MSVCPRGKWQPGYCKCVLLYSLYIVLLPFLLTIAKTSFIWVWSAKWATTWFFDWKYCHWAVMDSSFWHHHNIVCKLLIAYANHMATSCAFWSQSRLLSRFQRSTQLLYYLIIPNQTSTICFIILGTTGY